MSEDWGRAPPLPAVEPDGPLAFAIQEWLLWPERVVARRSHNAITPIGCPDFGFQSVAFRQRLRSRHRDLKLDDIDAACEALAELCRHRCETGTPVLAWLYRQWLQEASVDIAFVDDVPVIGCPTGQFMAWRHLVDRIDPDALACLVLAGEACTGGDLARAEAIVQQWPLVFNSRDLDVALLRRRGLTDLHLHMTSLWPVSLSWQRVLRFRTNRGEGKRLRHLAALHRRDLPAKYKECVENGTMCRPGRPARMPHLLGLRPPTEGFFRDDRVTPRPIAAVLAPERIMLLRAWHAMLASHRMRAEIEAELDEYIVAKSIFRELYSQPLVDTNKGLLAFDEIRRTGARLGAFDRDEGKAGAFSGRRFGRNKSFLILALRDSRSLRRAEVRIAPPSVRPKHLARSYCKTLLATDTLIKRMLKDVLGTTSRELDIRVALHFKRAASSSTGAAARDKLARRPPTMPLLRQLIEFDRDTAAFHDYRRRVSEAVVRHPGARSAANDLEALKRFSRIDLASPERGAGPWIIAPYVRLLRGDPQALALLGDPRSRTYFPKWFQLHKQRRAHFPIGSPEVRVTCHAGEDFFTLVDGLRHVDEAMTTWRMHQGDALGHCLALGLSPAHYLPSLNRVRVPLGVELDSLVWLRTLTRNRGLIDANLRYDLDERILALAKATYGELVYRWSHDKTDILSLLEAKVAEAGTPLLAPSGFAPFNLPVSSAHILEHAGSARAALRYADCFDPIVTARRASRQAPSPIHRRLTDVVGAVQQCLLDEIRNRRITIETNPSSNMRMERIKSPSALPVWNMLRNKTNPPAVTICTDNPGTYDINIETEYAVMHAALLASLGEENRTEALAILENMRAAGHRLFSTFSATSGNDWAAD